MTALPGVIRLSSPVELPLAELLELAVDRGDGAAQRAATALRSSIRQLVSSQESMIDALITSQDRLTALQSLTRINVGSLNSWDAMQHVLDESLELTESDAVAMIDDSATLTAGDPTAVATLLDEMRHAAAGLPAGRCGAMAAPGARTVLSVLDNQPGGRTVLGFGRRIRPYTTGDLRLIETVAAAAELMHTVTVLHRQELRQARIEREHQVASSLAQAVLRQPVPQIPGIELFVSSTPASLAGGDFVTFAVNDGILWFAVGDVAGKGLPAAMVMTKAVGATRVAFLTHPAADPGAALRTIGEELYDYLDEVALFVTVAVGSYAPETGILHLANAGHSPLFTCVSGTLAPVVPTTPPLGVLRDARSGSHRFVLSPGDSLIIGSDGLAEQENADGELFGYDRLRAVCDASAGAAADDAGNAILAAVRAHAGATAASDDCTLTVLRVSTAVVTTSRLHTRIDATTFGVRSIGPWLRELLAGIPGDEADILFGRLELATHEICMNSVDHAELGPGAILALAGECDDQSVRVTVSDSGRPFDSSEVSTPEPGVPQVRGYGLFIVGRMVDQLDYRRENDRNLWTLTLQRPTEDTG